MNMYLILHEMRVNHIIGPTDRLLNMSNDEEEEDSQRNDDSYKESLTLGREDALFSFNEHLRVFEEEASKASRIAQLDGIVLTIFLSILVARDGSLIEVINISTLAGLSLLAIGFIGGMVGQFSFTVPVGISEIGLNGLLDTEPNEVEYKEWSINHYIKWMKVAKRKGMWRARIVKGSAIASVFGLAFLLVGILLMLQNT